MKASRGIWIWSTLVLCAALVIGAMGWLTRKVLESKREQALAEIRAAVEEQTRLALWRMDAAGSAILVRENQRPTLQRNEADAPEVKALFTIGEKSDRIDGLDGAPLAALAHLPVSRFRNAVEASESAWQAVPKDNRALKLQASQKNLLPPQQNRFDSTYQQDFNRIELTQRAKVLDEQYSNAGAGYAFSYAERPVLRIGVVRPAWIDGSLFLLRKVVLAGGEQEILQGVWLDHEKVENTLLAEIPDLLPGAGLAPAEAGAADSLALVSLPFRLVRAPLPDSTPVSWGAPLIAGWIAVLCAIAMAAVLVRGVMRLSERRASFVSAVTHELRTPLTTFRLYSDMLESGAVKEEKRSDYLRALSAEADRLSHLVENVLAFSRIERGSARSRLAETDAASLLGPLRERFEARLAPAGLRLEMKLGSTRRFRADAAAVEHILFNLIDNAAKYAAGSQPPVVTLHARDEEKHIAISLCDRGPGISPAERRRIFRAFHKSAREAAESRPGVGLGLALSRRLAREQGGELSYESTPRGACFTLRLERR